jgi:hypothetical protein
MCIGWCNLDGHRVARYSPRAGRRDGTTNMRIRARGSIKSFNLGQRHRNSDSREGCLHHRYVCTSIDDFPPPSVVPLYLGCRGRAIPSIKQWDCETVSDADIIYIVYICYIYYIDWYVSYSTQWVQTCIQTDRSRDRIDDDGDDDGERIAISKTIHVVMIYQSMQKHQPRAEGSVWPNLMQLLAKLILGRGEERTQPNVESSERK